MYKSLILVFVLQFSILAMAQQSVSVQPGYANETYYSLVGGEAGSASLASWDLAFQIEGFAASIRSNHAMGILVYKVPRHSLRELCTFF
ncbi:MAG: hypothetical protein NWR72_19865 [Bacteroidia bacterium]|nr:hypothetical protein [Bacteroidia bacterium]